MVSSLDFSNLFLNLCFIKNITWFIYPDNDSRLRGQTVCRAPRRRHAPRRGDTLSLNRDLARKPFRPGLHLPRRLVSPCPVLPFYSAKLGQRVRPLALLWARLDGPATARSCRWGCCPIDGPLRCLRGRCASPAQCVAPPSMMAPVSDERLSALALGSAGAVPVVSAAAAAAVFGAVTVPGLLASPASRSIDSILFPFTVPSRSVPVATYPCGPGGALAGLPLCLFSTR